MQGETVPVLQALRGPVRRRVLELASRANKGHIGPALSVVDMIIAASAYLGIESDPRQSRALVLSKGHSASALYALLAELNLLSASDLNTYCHDGSLFGTHPSHGSPLIGMSTGSLGQGITFAVGMAMAKQLRSDPAPVVCVLSDSELNEGSTWEALMYAGHTRLSSLKVMLDSNGQQAMGRTKDILDTSPVDRAAEGFGWCVREVDGHDPHAQLEALRTSPTDRPLFLICRTVAGHGVSFMEGSVDWHYLPLTQEQLEAGCLEIQGRFM